MPLVLLLAISFALLIHFSTRLEKNLPQPRIVDLTMLLSPRTPRWPGSPPFFVKTLSSWKEGYYARALFFPEHFGTHVDAPAHFVRGAWTLDQIPPQNLVGVAFLLDMREKVQKNSDALLTVSDIQRSERAQIPCHGCFALVRTGWGKRSSSEKAYRHQDAAGRMHFPGVSREAVEYLLKHYDILGLGIDTLSIDNGISSDFPAHHSLLAHNRIAIENLQNLDKLPVRHFRLVVAPLKIEKASGSPARVLAFLEK